MNNRRIHLKRCLTYESILSSAADEHRYFPAVDNRIILLKQCLTYESIVNPAADEHRYFPAVNNKQTKKLI